MKAIGKKIRKALLKKAKKYCVAVDISYDSDYITRIMTKKEYKKDMYFGADYFHFNKKSEARIWQEAFDFGYETAKQKYSGDLTR